MCYKKFEESTAIGYCFTVVSYIATTFRIAVPFYTNTLLFILLNFSLITVEIY